MKKVLGVIGYGIGICAMLFISFKGIDFLERICFKPNKEEKE